MDIEQFRLGKRSDDELEDIVMKIATKCDIPIEFNKKVRNAIYLFQNGRRKEMAKWLKRSGRYIPMIHKIFAEEGIPQDMVYLSMIESGYNPRAYSRARAVGLWQFIYSTGKIYGLNRNQWIDERRDPVKSTKAAAKHLVDLYKISDDWNNVMAAYNCGARRIVSQLKKTENLEYWDMQLPRETRNYVPFFMAAVVISKAPEIFGFDNIEKDLPFEFDTVDVHPYTNLKTIAKISGVNIQEIKNLNPELLRDRVPPGKNMYSLRIPENTKEEFLVEYAKIPVEKYAPPRVEYVRVRRGDTFSGIADRNRISVSRLRAANPNIRNINRLRIGQRINMPGTIRTAVSSSTRKINTVSTKSVNISRENSFEYTVRRNDTLGIISEKFNTSVRTIQTINNMGRNTKIIIGEILIIPGKQKSSSLSQTRVVSRKETLTYTVKRNDSIVAIAEKYNTNVGKLQKHNDMT